MLVCGLIKGITRNNSHVVFCLDKTAFFVCFVFLTTIRVLVSHLIFHQLTVVYESFCSLIKGITQKNSHVVFCLNKTEFLLLLFFVLF